MEDWRLDDEIDFPWRMCFEEDSGGLDDKKAILHAKR